jgi:hypothetical protein
MVAQTAPNENGGRSISAGKMVTNDSRMGELWLALPIVEVDEILILAVILLVRVIVDAPVGSAASRCLAPQAAISGGTSRGSCGLSHIWRPLRIWYRDVAAAIVALRHK